MTCVHLRIGSEWLLNHINDEKKPKMKRYAEQTTSCKCHQTDQGNITADVLQCCFKYFLDETFPGIYSDSPTKFAKLLNTEDPDKELELKSIVIADEEKICNDSDRLETLNSINEKLKRICPEPFQKFNDSACIISSAQEISYDEAFSYCKEVRGADIFTMGSFDDDTILDEIIGKPFKNTWRFLILRVLLAIFYANSIINHIFQQIIL